ncbi:MAG TPA: hypothetical protein IGS52_16725 [Oscillatoriaceae cyanobacterium M33_DOE_052]|uniref:Uncharacterized protein n=1 Tax=Planktothricoides sp. SpSt-374 TaxID=2282167 RepID=A0A7C3ZQJ4_9CYAN|nr:hypothetical protein [Oscillatoriaceae cyanobacterium M33_DOE_052]
MRLKVSENGLVIPPSLLTGLEEVEVRREGDVISIQKINNIDAQETIEISILKGEFAQNLLEEKLQKIKFLKAKPSLDPAKLALKSRFSQLCREVQELHADNPLSEADIAAEIEAVRSGE